MITALTTDVVRSGDNYLYVLNGTPSARRAVRPWPGSEHGRRVHPGRALDRRGVPAAGGWGRRGVSPLGAAAQARCLSVGTHGAGRRPQRRSPAPTARRFPAVTHPGWPRLRSRRAVLPRRACCRRGSSLSRALRPAASASLRFAPGRPLTASFPGKIRRLPGGPGKVRDTPAPVAGQNSAAPPL